MNKSLSEEDLFKMNASLKHRGPDASGVFCDKIVGLGHTRLSILDTSTLGNQPMYSKNEKYVIVFNGEIYNYKDLKNKYLFDFPLSSHTDTEVLLECFLRKGTDIFQELNGMFAGAIYSIQNQELILFRDKMGKKPLFYYQSNDYWVFGSEIKAIKRTLPENLTIDKQQIYNFLHLNFIPEPYTIFKEIRKLEAGHWLKISAKGFDKKSYIVWQEADNKPINSENEAINSINISLENAVRRRLQSDVPWGCLLSGGVDSSIVTAIAAKESSVKFPTFTIGFENPKFDERPFASRIASKLGVKYHDYQLNEQDLLGRITGMNAIFDEPFGDTSAIPTLLVSEMASKQVKMVLTGDGGDELFLGYGTHIWAERIKNIPNPILSFASKVLNFLPDSKYKRVAHLLDFECVTNNFSHIYSQEHYLFSEKELKLLLNSQYYNTSQSIDNQPINAQNQSIWEIEHYLKDDLLVKVDRCSLYHSLEMRSPFLDDEVLSTSIKINPNIKLKNGVGKYLIKKHLESYLPNELIYRKKQGFSVPLAKWLLNDLNNLLEKYTSNEIIEKYQIFNSDLIKKYKYNFYYGQTYLYNRLWLVVSLHMWMERFES
ncbi:MAG: asparagine synthase (glutamine-hydrolyzing) [Bacteroidota bacterium]|nr:asparagine synthase (glutamine-hydrolyzing) [Bacteroidota bacterium]